MNWPWTELGLSGPTELSAIRRAYAERLKETRPEENPEGFQRLHGAYQAACRLARRGAGDGADGEGDTNAGNDTNDTNAGDDTNEFGGDESPSGGDKETERDPEPVRNESGNGDTRRRGNGDTERDSGNVPDEPDAPENREEIRESGTVFTPKEWDFERLFAEGAAEERGRRFQKLLELRQKNRLRYETWNPPPSADPAEAALHWVAVSRSIDLLEELTFSGADAALWQFFVQSELFRYVKNYPDFVFALEDFLRERTEIPETGRRILFRAYELDAPPIRKEYGELYRLLSGDADGRGVSSAFDGSANPRRKARGFSSNFIAVLLLVLSLSLMNGCVDFLVREALRKEQVRVWMEEDFGGEFVRTEKWSFGRAFALLDMRTGIRFRARWDGPRDRERDKRGYVTDYAEARMFAELSAFASRWNWTISQQRAQSPENSGVYLSVPLTGAGEGIRALEPLLSAVRRKDWYRELPSTGPLYLCWADWSFYEYNAGEESFDGAAAQWYYERFFGPDLCRIALEETGLASSDIGEAMLFPQEGAVTLEGRRFFHVAGTGTPPGKALFHYFLSEDGAELFCVPSDRKFSELSLESLRRMGEKEYDVKGFPEKLRVFRAAPD